MKIVVIPSADNFNNSKSTAVIHTSEVIRFLSQNNSIFLYANYAEKITNHSQNVHISKLNIPKNKIFAALYSYAYLPFIFIIKFKDTKADVVYARYASFSFASLIAARFHGKKYVTEVNGVKTLEVGNESIIDKFKLFIFRKYEAYIYKYSDKIVVVSNGIGKFIANNFKKTNNKIVVIPNGANVDKFKPIPDAKSSLNLDQKQLYIGFIGHLESWQGVEYLIKSLSDIIKIRKEVHLVIVGDGPMLDAYKQQSRDLNIDSYVTFTGRVEYDKVPLWINAFDVCVAPFNKGRLASPIKIFEYMACKRKIISSDIDDVINLKESDKYITFFKAGNSKDLTDKIKLVLDNKENSELEATLGYKILKENYTWSKTSKKVEDLLKSTT